MVSDDRAGRFFPVLLRHPRAVLSFWVALAALAAPGLIELAHENSPEVYFVRDHEALSRYERFAEVFGDFGALRIWAAGDGLWTREGLAWLAAVEDAAPRISGVFAATGPWSYRRARVPEAEWPPLDVTAWREALGTDRLARSADLISSHGEAVVVLLATRRVDAAERRALLLAVEELVAERPTGIEVGFAGLATVNRALDEALGGVLSRQLPIAMLLGILLVALCLRSIRDTALTVFFSAICQTVLLGVMGYFGQAFNVVTSVLPLLVFVLSLATAIHLLSDARERGREGLSARAAVLATCRYKAWPVVWTAVTTGAAFGSLAWSDSPPVRSLGLWSAAGIVLVMAAALTLFPVLLSEGRRPSSTVARTHFEVLARALGLRCCELALSHRGLVHVVFVALFALALAGLPRLEVETSVLEYFSSDHRERQAVESIERLGVGPVSAELVLKLGDGKFGDGDRTERLAQLTESLRSTPPALGALGFADLPRSQVPFFRRARALLLSENDSIARVSIAIPFAGFTELEPFFDHALETAKRSFPAAEAYVTGAYPMVLAAQRSLLETMVVSLGVTLLLVMVMLLVLVPNGRLTLATLLPNLWPVAVALGVMGWLNVAVDSGTMMIAAVVLGLAVDDTLHFLGGLRVFGGEAPSDRTIRATLVRLAPAHLLTSLVLAAGLLTLGGSSFLPVARFGAISALAVTAALAGDLLWVPALAARTPSGQNGSA